ncbi:hypothetical protein PV325_001659 [Microctonus aethiopoides]|nr:hypothetical protein PV325_001659 [Microctonus aethiopoides]
MVSPSKVQPQNQKPLPKDKKIQRQSHIRLQRGDKPLEKKKFYLDIKNHALANKLEIKIKDFGGSVELFLDQSVTLIVSDRVDKFEQANSEKQKWGYTSGGSVGPPSLRSIEVPTSTWTPPTPSLNGECPLSNSTNTRGQPAQRTRSRVDAMLERALTQPQQCSVDPLDNAHNWGIPIWTTDKLQAWLDKIYVSLKDSNNTLKTVNRTGTEKNLKVKDFTKSYIKFESFRRDTRPVFLELPVWPTLNFDGEPGTCPFDKKIRERKEDKAKSDKDKKKEMTRKPRPNATRGRRSEQLVGGCCEICRCDYRDLTKHVQSDKHLTFVRNGDNFLSLDSLINAGANVEAFLKLNRSDDVRQDLFSNGNDSLHDVVIRSEKDSSTKANLNDFNVDELKMVQCNGAQRKLNLKLSSPHNLRTRTKHESGHLLRSKGSPWHEVDKSEKFYEKFEKYTIKKRSKGTIWIEEDDPPDKCTDDEQIKDTKTSQIVEKTPLTELNDVRLKNKDSNEQSPKKNQQLSRIEERRDRKKGNVNCSNEEKSTSENTKADVNSDELIISKKSNSSVRLTPNKDEIILNKDFQLNGAFKSSSSAVPVNVQKQNDRIDVTQSPNNHDTKIETEVINSKNIELNKKPLDKVSEICPQSNGDDKKDEKSRHCRAIKRNIRSSRARQRLSVEERLIEDNRAYYKVEVLGNKLRSSTAHLTNNHSPVIKEIKKEVEKEVKEVKEVKKDDGPSSEKPVVVRFKRVRKSELSLLSDEAESFMFGDSRRDDTSGTSDWNNESSSGGSSVLPKDTSSELANDSTSSLNNVSSPTVDGTLNNRTIKQEPIDDDSEDSSYLGRAKKRRRTQAEALIMDNVDYYKFETPGSRLRFQAPTAGVKDPKQIIDNNSSNATTTTKANCNDVEIIVDATQNVEEKLYPSKPSAEVEKMRFSFETVPKSEPWYQTYQRQDEGAEFWHYFSEADARKPFLLPYEIENFHENLLKICQKNEARKKASRLQGRNGLLRSPRKSPRCHASTLAIMSTIIRKREQQQQQNQQQHSLNLDTIEEESRSGANTPNINTGKSSTDNELRDIVKSIDDMLNADVIFDDSFERETLDLIKEENEDGDTKGATVGSECQPSGPPSDLIDLLDNSHQYSGFDNSSCASSECGEAITESPLKRRKRRKNRTGWPGIKIRRKLQNKRVTIPDVDSERENVPDKSQNTEGEEEDEEEDEEEEEEEEEVAEVEEEVEVSGTNRRNQQSIRERLQGSSSIETSIISQEMRIPKCKTSDFIDSQLSNENNKKSYDNDDSSSRKRHGNDENHENVLFRQDGRVTCTRQQIISKSITRRRQRDNDSRPSSSFTVDSNSSIDNRESSLYRQKGASGIISRKNYSTGTSIAKRRQRDITGRDSGEIEIIDGELTTATTPLVDAQHRDSTVCKKSDSVTPKKQQQTRTRKRLRKSTSESNFDNENCRKDQNDSSTGDVDCAMMSERVNSTVVNTSEMQQQQQRRSSIEFQPVVRVMKIEDQVEMDHGILSVTVASNRRLRSSTSPKLNSSPPKKRYKRSKGPLGRWIKNS